MYDRNLCIRITLIEIYCGKRDRRFKIVKLEIVGIVIR